MRSTSESPGDATVNSSGPIGSEERQDAEALPPTTSLTPERLAWLRSWVAARKYANPQTDLLIASRILEQGDL